MDRRAFGIGLAAGAAVMAAGTAVVSLSWDWLLELIVVLLGITVMMVPVTYALRPTAELEGDVLKLRGLRLHEDLRLEDVRSYRTAERLTLQFRWQGSNGFRFKSGYFRTEGANAHLCYDIKVPCVIVMYTSDGMYAVNKGSVDETLALLEKMRPLMVNAEESADREAGGVRDLRSRGFEILAVAAILLFALMLVSAIVVF